MRRTAFALLLAALLLLSSACSQDLAPHASRPVRLQQVAASVAPGFALVDPSTMPGNGHPDRNVFVYCEKPTVVVATPHYGQQAIVTPVVTLPPSGDSAKQPEKPPFPYRCIGRFGPEGAQLVAFIVDGEVKLARAGEVLENRYLVRGIGIESVEVGLLSAPEVSWRLEFGK